MKVNLDLIKKRRKEKHISLQKMAETLGFKNASNYYKYENGDYSFGADHIPVISEKLDIPMDEIFSVQKIAELANDDHKASSA